MSVIVKGMEMPNNCVNCEFGLYRFGTICQLRDYERNVPQKYIDDDIRPDWCPLVEIPEDARLIDGNALVDSLGIRNIDYYCEEIIDDAPTIFEED